MNNSLKISAVSGLIAGIIADILYIFYGLIFIIIRIGYWEFQTLTITAIKKIAFAEITISMIWWIIAGLFYVKIYDLIPGKRVLKDLCTNMLASKRTV